MTGRHFNLYLESLCGKTFDNQYLIDKVIGTGAYAGVLSAVVARSGQSVAIKVPKKADKSIIHEASVMTLIGNSKYSVDILYPEPYLRDTRYLVLSLERQTLADYWKANPKISNAVVSAIGIDLTEALRYIHLQRVMHRDISVRNSLISLSPGKRRVILCDYGMSSYRDDDGGFHAAVDTSSHAYGFYTPLFVMHGRRYRPLDDVYSMVYLMLFMKRTNIYTSDLAEWQRVKKRLYEDIRGTLPAAEQVFYKAIHHLFRCDRRAGGNTQMDCYRRILHHLRRVPGYHEDLAL